MCFYYVKQISYFEDCKQNIMQDKMNGESKKTWFIKNGINEDSAEGKKEFDNNSSH